MRLKPGVRVRGLSSEALVAVLVASEVVGSVSSEGLVVTSVTDSNHRLGSLHYTGDAFDFRRWNIPPEQISWVLQELRDRLPGYNVILEDDHFHVEYDPDRS